jgi:hypothetical protein
MGSMPRLRIKTDLNYHAARASETRCSECKNLCKEEIFGIGHASLGFQYRCKLVGFNSSVRYRINPKYTCDSWEFNKPELLGSTND